MKNNYIKLLLCFCTFISIDAIGQNVMVIEKNNKEIVKVGINDIKRVYFESMDSESAKDTLKTIYKQMCTYGWSVTGNTHQSFGITSYALCADFMGEDNIMAKKGSGWFWFDATYDIKKRYESTAWRSYDLWTAYYTWIRSCNQLIAAKETMGGSEEDVKKIVGQAYAIRAYSYFMLSQFFARTLVGHENEPCVPIYTEPITPETKGNPRSTNSEVYALIDDDIDKASELLKGIERDKNWWYNTMYIDYSIAQGIKARICMVENKWADAKTAAHNAIDNSGCSILPTSTFAGLNNVFLDNVLWGAPIDDTTIGMYASLFSHMDYDANLYAGKAPKCINKELYEKMAQTDSRRDWWVSNVSSDGLLQEKFKFSDATRWLGDYVYMRIEEMYLTAAEAECRLGEEDAAKEDLMAVMSQRDANYSTTKTGTALGATSATVDETGSLLEEILIQRRIELWGEFGRMFDLKRLKQGFRRTTAQGWPADALLDDRPTEDPEAYMNVLTIPQSEFDWNESLNFETDQNPIKDYPE